MLVFYNTPTRSTTQGKAKPPHSNRGIGNQRWVFYKTVQKSHPYTQQSTPTVAHTHTLFTHICTISNHNPAATYDLHTHTPVYTHAALHTPDLIAHTRTLSHTHALKQIQAQPHTNIEPTTYSHQFLN